MNTAECAKNLRTIAEQIEGDYITGDLTLAEYRDRARQINKRCEIAGITPVAVLIKEAQNV